MSGTVLQQVRFRKAEPEDATTLSSLAFRSKASWGYDIDFMKRCRKELSYDAAEIESPDNVFYLCEINEEPVAFYALAMLGEGRAELEALFVRPGFIGQGFGKLLIEHMAAQAQALAIHTVTIQGDPNAEEFYLSIGAVPGGYRESASIRGRYLPVFVLSIGEGDKQCR